MKVISFGAGRGVWKMVARLSRMLKVSSNPSRVERSIKLSAVLFLSEIKLRSTAASATDPNPG